jgi:hypothetical protein
MTTWYVATLACYVLVDGNEARAKGRVALYDLYADLREHFGREVPIEIHTVRPATNDEVQLWKWHHAMVVREAARRA